MLPIGPSEGPIESQLQPATGKGQMSPSLRGWLLQQPERSEARKLWDIA